MIRSGWRLSCVAVVLGLAACASAPLHYYTLVPPAGEPAGMVSPFAGSGASMPFELLPVSVPAQVDQPQLVVREGSQGVALLDGERWIAPLGDELRGALSADLARELHSQDASGLPDNDKLRLRIKLDVRRFDSQPGSYALIEGNWSVRVLHGASESAVACTSRISESVGPGYDALVQGHQQAIGQLAGQIAVAARALADGQAAACPAP
ncbi:MAG TPA: PqiC family protein [Rhodanobacter sp.]